MGVLDSSLDPQAVGWRDDGSEGGVVRVDPIGNDLVAMPFLPTNTVIAVTGAGASFSWSTIGRLQNSTTLCYQFFCNNPAIAALGGGGVMNFWFHGNRLGLIYHANTLTPMGCRIDGVAYEVPLPGQVDLDTQVASTVWDILPAVMVATDLGDGPHYVQLDLPADPLGLSATTFTLYGYLVEAAAGYVRREPMARAVPVHMTVTTTPQTIGNALGTTAVVGADNFILVNTTGAPIIVSLLPPGTNAVDIPISVAANGYTTFNPSPSKSLSDWTVWTISAASSGLKLMIVGTT